MNIQSEIYYILLLLLLLLLLLYCSLFLYSTLWLVLQFLYSFLLPANLFNAMWFDSPASAIICSTNEVLGYLRSVFPSIFHSIILYTS
jgi:hypothetical protein